MSWETLVTGSVAFKSGTPECLKLKIIDDLEAVLETSLEWDPKWKEYRFEDVNWSSHVDEKEIEKVYRKWKPFFKLFSVSLYYLSEADYSEYSEDEDQDASNILESILEELVEALVNGEYDVADNAFEVLVKFLKAAKVDRGVVAEKIDMLSKALEEEKMFEVDKSNLVELNSILEDMKIPTARLRKVLLAEAL